MYRHPSTPQLGFRLRQIMVYKAPTYPKLFRNISLPINLRQSCIMPDTIDPSTDGRRLTSESAASGNDSSVLRAKRGKGAAVICPMLPTTVGPGSATTWEDGTSTSGAPAEGSARWKFLLLADDKMTVRQTSQLYHFKEMFNVALKNPQRFPSTNPGISTIDGRVRSESAIQRSMGRRMRDKVLETGGDVYVPEKVGESHPYRHGKIFLDVKAFVVNTETFEHCSETLEAPKRDDV